MTSEGELGEKSEISMGKSKNSWLEKNRQKNREKNSTGVSSMQIRELSESEIRTIDCATTHSSPTAKFALQSSQY